MLILAFSYNKVCSGVFRCQKSWKNNGARTFDLISAVFGAFDILSITHSVNSKIYDSFFIILWHQIDSSCPDA